MEIGEQQKEFVKEYIKLKCSNATQAAINAGYSPKTARQQGSRLLSYAHVQEYLKEQKDKIQDEIRESLLFECKRAVEVEFEILNNPDARDRDRLDAAKDILDRAGFKPTDEVKVSGNVNNPFEGLTTADLKKLIDDE